MATTAAGLSDEELARIEGEFGFEFADDHRAFLSSTLPVGDSWPDWRCAPRRSLHQRLRLPIDGILFAVEWRDFWGSDWGERPARMKDALRSANYHLARVPQLVPLHANHYLPAGRRASGHPVLSIYQTDVSCCAADVFDYANPDPARKSVSTVPFWSGLIG
ncbi:SMI1/KNR4 family protein [Mycolicibacterium aichiense]|uniref:SMI1/KNR4 family protein n=1 Tax=Mycolicibacterium aichiense TaxID=1799 RepID=UPI003D6767F0